MSFFFDVADSTNNEARIGFISGGNTRFVFTFVNGICIKNVDIEGSLGIISCTSNQINTRCVWNPKGVNFYVQSIDTGRTFVDYHVNIDSSFKWESFKCALGKWKESVTLKGKMRDYRLCTNTGITGEILSKIIKHFGENAIRSVETKSIIINCSSQRMEEAKRYEWFDSYEEYSTMLTGARLAQSEQSPWDSERSSFYEETGLIGYWGESYVDTEHGLVRLSSK